MALVTKVGAFNTTTNAATNTVAVTGVGANLSTTPFAILFWWSGKTSTTDSQSEEDIQGGFGVALSTSSRRCVAWQSDHGAATSTCHNGNFNDCCLASITTAGAIDGKMDFQSADADGFTLSIDNNFARDLRIHYLVIAHESLSVALNTIALPTSETTQDINVGFALNTGVNDKAVFFFNGDGFAAVNSIDTWIMACVGIAANNTPFNASVLASSEGDGAASSNTNGNGSSGTCFQLGFGGNTINCSVTTWLATGYRLSWVGNGMGASNHDIFSLTIKGIDLFAGETATRTDTTPFSVTGLAFAPGAVMAGSAGRVEDSPPTGTLLNWSTHAHLSLGAVDDDLNQGSQSHFDRDNSANMDSATAVEHDAIYHHNSTANPSVTDGICAVTSLNSDGFTMAMSDADSVAAWMWYLAIGPKATAATKARPFFNRSQRFFRR